MTSVTHVFNQYYWDLLKKCKDIVRDQKYKAESSTARSILKEIKASYMSFDKASDEHLQWYADHVSSPWKDFASGNDWKGWHSNASLQEVALYKGITIGSLVSVFKAKDVLLYYLVLFSVLTSEAVTDENVSSVLGLLRKQEPYSDEDLAVLKDEYVIRNMRLLQEIAASSASSASASASSPADRLMSELENTSLGKLAKEIMEEVDVNELQKSMTENGDIMKAFADPNTGVSKLIGNVTSKMISKLASGELKQESLLNDAMKLAGSLGGGKGAGGGGGMGDMLGQMASLFGGGNDGDFDIASMMKNMMNPKSGGHGTRTAVNSAALTRNVKAKQLRKKLDERRKTKENIETHVGDK